MKKRAISLLAFALLGLAQTSSGPRPNGWIVRPLGRITPQAGFPIASTVSPDGKYIAVLTAGSRARVNLFSTKTELSIAELELPGAWLGLAYSPNGALVYVSGGATGNIYELRVLQDGALERGRTFPALADASDGLLGDVAVSPDGRMLYAGDVLGDRVLVINLSSGRVIERYSAPRRPYRIAFHPDGKTYFVTGWADGSVTQYDALSGRRLNGAQVGAHATDIAWRDKKTQIEEGEETPWAARLFIPAANTNNVYSVAISSSNDLRVVERIQIGLFVNEAVGMTPSAVALSPDQSHLYVACSDANALAVLDVSGVKSRLLGFIPTGEYPTAVRTLADGRLFVLNGSGSVLFLNAPADDALALQSGVVLANSPLKEQRQRPIAYNPIPFTPGETTPIDHIVYILKEGAPHTRHGEPNAPNQFKLAREFTSVPLTATGDSPIDGIYWSTAGIVPDFIQKLRPIIRDNKPKVDELDLAAQPPAGFLWNQVTSRLYGVSPTVRSPRGIVTAPGANTEFRPPDRAISDVDRAQVFLRDFQTMDEQQSLPKLTIIRLANDRPAPDVRGQRTQQAAIADNDYALGLIIERLSHSKYWPKMAIFVAGIQAPDHATSAFVVSPFSVRGRPAVGSFNTLSVLRSIELILGLAPMTQFDAGAMPLEAAFQSTPDLRPYDAERPRVSIDAMAQ